MFPKTSFFLSCYIIVSQLGCGVPDLAQSDVLTEATEEAIPLDSLERKLMYGMHQLFVDESDEPFTGWVYQENQAELEYSLGYLKKGRREGLWITWHPNKIKKSEIEWKEDRMEGKFHVWHPNGKTKVIGQTNDGEVDGEWTEYYSNSQKRSQSMNHHGHLVSIQVWKPDGTRCQASRVMDGNGSFTRYLDNGLPEHIRTFSFGVETSRQTFP